MNVVTKSPNLAPFLKATATAVSNGGRPVAGSGKVTRPKIATLPLVNRLVGLTSQDILSGPVCVSTGISVSTHIQPARCAHSDIQIPDFSYYRTEASKDPSVKTREQGGNQKVMSYLVAAGAGLTVTYGAKTVVTQFLMTLAASADVLAMSKIEVKLDAIPEGRSAVFKWRGKPVFIRHRTAKEIATEQAVDVSSLRDPQTDTVRVKDPKWLVVLGVCTHLGCVPIANAGEFGGYYCPCHGSHYDASGRIRKGPAPLNLEVPEYNFSEDGAMVVVG